MQLLDGLYRPDSYEYRLAPSRVGVGSANVWMPAERFAESSSD
ncbi:GntR family transcriptional regulator [Polaromonas sp. OV174]|nr:GntR family transcriptional regulator [Polaromonas sp. OV174]